MAGRALRSRRDPHPGQDLLAAQDRRAVIPISESLREALLAEYAERRSDQWVAANRAGCQEFHLLPKLKKMPQGRYHCRRDGPCSASFLRGSLADGSGA